MSRIRRTWWAVALTSVFTTALTSVGVPAASAADPAECVALVATTNENVPAPLVCDRSGADMDEFVVPSGTNGYYIIAGRELPSGVNPSGGLPSVTVNTQYFGPDGLQAGPDYVLPFDTAVTAPEAVNRNAFVVVPNSCNPKTGYTTVQGGFTNVADASHRYVNEVPMYLERRADGDGPLLPFTARRVMDGETQMLNTALVLPGTYKVEIYDPAQGMIDLVPDLVVGNCGKAIPPTTGGGQVPSASKPEGSLRQVRGTTKMKVKMVNKKVATTTIFTVTIDKPGKGGMTVRTFKVRKNAVKKLKRPFVAPVNTTFVLRAIVTLNRPDGSIATKKMIITRNKIRPGTSGKSA